MKPYIQTPKIKNLELIISLFDKLIFGFIVVIFVVYARGILNYKEKINLIIFFIIFAIFLFSRVYYTSQIYKEVEKQMEEK